MLVKAGNKLESRPMGIDILCPGNPTLPYEGVVVIRPMCAQSGTDVPLCIMA